MSARAKLMGVSSHISKDGMRSRKPTGSSGLMAGAGRRLTPVAYSHGKIVAPSLLSILPGYGFRCGSTIIREGQGSGEGRAASPGEVHDTALKAAETDATKRALATFGKPFGLALYGVGKSPSIQPGMPLQPGLAETVQRFGFHPDDTTPIPRPSRTPGRIDKSQLAIAEPKRLRDKAHLEFVASQPYLICGRQPSDPHHLRFAQPRAMGLKVSDEFTVPLCRGHHRQLHQAGNEVTWWENVQIDALATAKDLWKQTHTKDGCVDAQNNG
jgi:Rad52/22 family double-strand break repair protein